MPKIFISYRRQDTEVHVGRIYDRLVAAYQADNVFLDVDSMIVGLDFRALLAEAVGACDVLVAVIGDGWVNAADEQGRRRLDNPADFVRIEIETAFAREIPVIPLILGSRGVPRPEELPESLHPLAFRHGEFVRLTPRDFHTDMDRFLRGIEKLTARLRVAPQPAAPHPSLAAKPASTNTPTAAKAPPAPVHPPSAFVGAKAGELRTLTHKGVAIPLCWCPPGSFLMGTPGATNNERPAHVELTQGFWMGQTPVTQELYQAVLGKNPSRFKGPRRPVERVSWDDAVEFCAQLTDLLHAASTLPKDWNVLLPTEAQWEYAARAGTTTERSFGANDSLSRYAWFDENSGQKTHDVATLRANPWNLHDVYGNVWEWCRDWYVETLPGGKDPTGPSAEGSNRVGRGGSWYYDGWFCRSAYRGRFSPEFRGNDLGFRLASGPSGT